MDFPLRPRLSRSIPIGRLRLKRLRLGLRPESQSGREVVVNRMAHSHPLLLGIPRLFLLCKASDNSWNAELPG